MDDNNNDIIVPDQVQVSQDKSIESLRPKQLKFLVLYLKSGEVAKSYQKIYKSSKATAIVNGSKLLKKYKEVRSLLYEANGLGEKAMMKAIKEALSSEKGMKATKYYKDGTIKEEVDSRQPDHFIRLKAVEIRNKTLGVDTPDQGKQGNTLNVFIVKDKAKNIFQVAEEGEVVQ